MTPPLRVQPRPESARPALPVPAGLILTAAGAILLLAVHARLSYLDLRTTGLIVMALGLTWLWIPVRGKRELTRRCSGRVIGYLQWDSGKPQATRYPLTDLLTESGPEHELAMLPSPARPG